MRLESLELTNFRRFRDARIEFADGLIGLVGRNGAGKSTIIESIGWAIFGHDAARTGKDLIRWRGADDGDDCRVLLRFSLGGHAYEVERALVGKSQSHTAKLSVDGHVVVAPGAQSHREATRYLERVFHMDRQSFFTSLVARQRELNALTDMTPGNRQKIVMSMLRIDAVDAAIRSARESKRDARNRLEGIRLHLLDPKELEARGVDVETRAARAAEERARLTLESKAAAEAAVAARATREAWQARAEEHARLAAALAERQARLEAVDAEGEKLRAERERAVRAAVELESVAPRVQELPAAREALERLTLAKERHAQAERVRRDLAAAEKEVTRLRAAASEAHALAAASEPARKLLERVRKALESERERLAAAEKRATEAAAAKGHRAMEAERVRVRLKGVERIGPDSPCPTCTRPLREHYDAITGALRSDVADHARAADASDALRQAAEAEAAESRARVADLAERERELAEKVAEHANFGARVEELSSRLAAEEARMRDVAAASAALAAQPVSAEELVAARTRVAELERAAKRAAALEADAARRADVEALMEDQAARAAAARAAVGETKEAVVALGFDAGAFQEATRALERAQERVGEARVAMERAAAESARVEEERKRLAEDRERQARLESEAATLAEEVRYMERLAGDREGGLLADFKQHLVARVRPLLSFHASEAFRDLTDGKYAGLEVNEEYDLVVDEDGARFGLERYSGGETDLANLCLRLAVSQVLAERAGGAAFEFIVLDEIFGSQDAVRKANILRALAGLSHKFRQILLVTHIEDVKESVEHVVRVEEGPDGASVVRAE